MLLLRPDRRVKFREKCSVLQIYCKHRFSILYTGPKSNKHPPSTPHTSFTLCRQEKPGPADKELGGTPELAGSGTEAQVKQEVTDRKSARVTYCCRHLASKTGILEEDLKARPPVKYFKFTLQSQPVMSYCTMTGQMYLALNRVGTGGDGSTVKRYNKYYGTLI